jgi:hypothetical protein
MTMLEVTGSGLAGEMVCGPSPAIPKLIRVRFLQRRAERADRARGCARAVSGDRVGRVTGAVHGEDGCVKGEGQKQREDNEGRTKHRQTLHDRRRSTTV